MVLGHKIAGATNAAEQLCEDIVAGGITNIFGEVQLSGSMVGSKQASISFDRCGFFVVYVCPRAVRRGPALTADMPLSTLRRVAWIQVPHGGGRG